MPGLRRRVGGTWGRRCSCLRRFTRRSMDTAFVYLEKLLIGRQRQYQRENAHSATGLGSTHCSDCRWSTCGAHTRKTVTGPLQILRFTKSLHSCDYGLEDPHLQACCKGGRWTERRDHQVVGVLRAQDPNGQRECLVLIKLALIRKTEFLYRKLFSTWKRSLRSLWAYMSGMSLSTWLFVLLLINHSHLMGMDF